MHKLTLISGKKGKGTEFSVTLLAYFLPRSLMDLGCASDAQRPAWVAYLGSEQEARAFTANFRSGRKAKTSYWPNLQLRKSDPYRVTQVPAAGGGILTTHVLPELFQLEPLMPGDQVAFIFAPPTWWIESQAQELAADFGADAQDAARAALFTAYLDRRTEMPIVNDLRFHLALYRQALKQEWADLDDESAYRYARGLATVGLDPAALYIKTDRDELATFLAAQTALYFEEEIRNGKNRIPADSRLLPLPDASPTQLCFNFGLGA